MATGVKNFIWAAGLMGITRSVFVFGAIWLRYRPEYYTPQFLGTCLEFSEYMAFTGGVYLFGMWLLGKCCPPSPAGE